MALYVVHTGRCLQIPLHPATCTQFLQWLQRHFPWQSLSFFLLFPLPPCPSPSLLFGVNPATLFYISSDNPLLTPYLKSHGGTQGKLQGAREEEVMNSYTLIFCPYNDLEDL